ncbi:MAG: hypothetical protein JW703_02525 [Candidatus Diapherotrites archaeon]|nr:hypothetical protein [Candidatus Diapherotrites archaeon]
MIDLMIPSLLSFLLSILCNIILAFAIGKTTDKELKKIFNWFYLTMLIFALSQLSVIILILNGKVQEMLFLVQGFYAILISTTLVKTIGEIKQYTQKLPKVKSNGL